MVVCRGAATDPKLSFTLRSNFCHLSMKPKMLFRTRLLVVFFNVLLICKPAYAQGDTGPVGLQGVGDLRMQLTIYPCVAIGLSFLIFKITGKAWVFFLTPLIIMGLGSIAPIDPTSTSLDLPAFFSWAGAWFYWTHTLAIAIVYSIFNKTKKAWVFLLAPIIGWAIQIGSFVIILSAQ